MVGSGRIGSAKAHFAPLDVHDVEKRGVGGQRQQAEARSQSWPVEQLRHNDLGFRERQLKRSTNGGFEFDPGNGPNEHLSDHQPLEQKSCAVETKANR